MTRRRAIALLVVALAVVLLVAACGGKGDRNAPPQSTDTVSMRDNEFRPNHVSVPSGTTVTWTNDDSFPHDVTFSEGPASGVLDGGDAWEHAFAEAGTFDYECTIHPGMVGRVTVTGG